MEAPSKGDAWALMWVEKHRPANPAQMVGNEDSRIGFMKWLKAWTSKSKPALLLGPPGTGKTTVVHAVAKMLGYRLFELNASDSRTKERLEKILGPLTTTTNLFGEKTLIFLDEVDGLYGRQDYGGLDYVLGLIGEGVGPLVMAANDAEDDKIRKLAGRCTTYRFKPVAPRLIEVYLRSLLDRESGSVPQQVLEDIASKSMGDVRSAVNDLQSAVELPSAVAPPSYGRNRVLSGREAVDALSRAGSVEEAVGVLRSWDAQPQEKLRTLFTSVLGSKLEAEALSRALEALAKADGLLGEIVGTQNWKLLRYFDTILASGLRNALPNGGLAFYEDDLPWNIKLRIWNDGRALKQVRDKVSRRFRVSRGDAVSVLLPYFTVILGGKRGAMERFAELLRLEESEVKVLLKEASRRGGKS